MGQFNVKNSRHKSILQIWGLCECNDFLLPYIKKRRYVKVYFKLKLKIGHRKNIAHNPKWSVMCPLYPSKINQSINNGHPVHFILYIQATLYFLSFQDSSVPTSIALKPISLTSSSTTSSGPSRRSLKIEEYKKKRGIIQLINKLLISQTFNAVSLHSYLRFYEHNLHCKNNFITFYHKI